MSNIEFVVVALGILGGSITVLRFIYKLAETKSGIEKQIVAKNEELHRLLRNATQKIELQLKEIEGQQQQENYRFRVLESQIQDLRNHQSDVQKFLQSQLSYNPRPYAALENTQGRRRLDDGSWVEFEN